MKVRNLRASDRSQLELLLASIEQFTSVQVGWALDLAAQAASSENRGDYTCCVTADGSGKLTGYACFGPVPRAEGVFDLYWIAVHPREQRRGIGTTLLQAVEAEVLKRGGRMMLIETSSKGSYRPAARFYERNGYREVSRIKDFYRVEDDKIVFGRRLK